MVVLTVHYHTYDTEFNFIKFYQKYFNELRAQRSHFGKLLSQLVPKQAMNLCYFYLLFLEGAINEINDSDFATYDREQLLQQYKV